MARLLLRLFIELIGWERSVLIATPIIMCGPFKARAGTARRELSGSYYSPRSPTNLVLTTPTFATHDGYFEPLNLVHPTGPPVLQSPYASPTAASVSHSRGNVSSSAFASRRFADRSGPDRPGGSVRAAR